jgi:hypothetical protein
MLSLISTTTDMIKTRPTPNYIPFQSIFFSYQRKANGHFSDDPLMTDALLKRLLHYTGAMAG